MIRRNLIDPRLPDRLPALFPSRCTIKSVTITVGASGQRVVTGSSNVMDKVDIPCRLAPILYDDPKDDQYRGPDKTVARSYRTCKLMGRYLGIASDETMFAVVDNETYQIRGVENDSQKLFTWLRLEIFTPPKVLISG